MNIDLALKKIRIQIKFGRVADAESSLLSLLDEYKDSEKEKEILTIFTLELSRKTKSYREAIPMLRRLLELDIDAQTRLQAFEFLNISIAKENLVESDPDISKKEFIDFMGPIRNRNIFKPAVSSFLHPKFFIVEDIELAEELAWRQGVEPPFQSWNTLRAKASSKIYGYYSDNRINMSAVHREVSREIRKICTEALSPIMMGFYDDIYGDLAMMAMGQLVDVVPELHVEMWGAYQNKCYPCGWRGNYPDGQLCIFPNS